MRSGRLHSPLGLVAEVRQDRFVVPPGAGLLATTEGGAGGVADSGRSFVGSPAAGLLRIPPAGEGAQKGGDAARGRECKTGRDKARLNPSPVSGGGEVGALQTAALALTPALSRTRERVQDRAGQAPTTQGRAGCRKGGRYRRPRASRRNGVVSSPAVGVTPLSDRRTATGFCPYNGEDPSWPAKTHIWHTARRARIAGTGPCVGLPSRHSLPRT